MAKVMSRCPDCAGTGNMPHIPRILAEGETPNPNGLDRYKILDICEACGGDGERLVEVNITEG